MEESNRAIAMTLSQKQKDAVTAQRRVRNDKSPFKRTLKMLKISLRIETRRERGGSSI